MKDRVGIGWRPELAAAILSHLDDIDVVEVIADDLFTAPAAHLRAIKTLAAQVPVVLHGVSLGLASASPVDRSRLDAMARVVHAIQPDFWSEHLAFVRSDGVEIGHLAAPPRTDATIDGASRNLELASTVVGTRPLMENIATLINPPASVYDETTWVSHVLSASNCDLLLDLNNLYTNAINFGFEPNDFLSRIPFERVAAVHLAGGKWITSSTGEKRLLDDHLHDVPIEVYRLLTEVGAKATRPLTVLLERDGVYPPFEQLLDQLSRARDALAIGRIRAIEQTNVPVHVVSDRAPYRAPAIESFLARLYVDKQIRKQFLADPIGTAKKAGFDAVACEALVSIDRVGLALAAQSFARKRTSKPARKSFRGLASSLLRKVMSVLVFAGLALAGCPAPSRKSDQLQRTECRAPDPKRDGGATLRTSDGVDLWYKIAGNAAGPVTIYLHGGPGYNSYAFEKSVGAELERGLRMIYFDQRGGGRSWAGGDSEKFGMKNSLDDIDRLRQESGAETVNLIAHSFGGLIAVEYARAYPGRVRKLLLIDISADIQAVFEQQLETLAQAAKKEHHTQARVVAAVARSTEASVFERLMKTYELLTPPFVWSHLHYAAKTGQERNLNLDRESGLGGCIPQAAVVAFDKEGFLDGHHGDDMDPLAVPAMLVAGRHSRVVGAANIEAAARAWNVPLQWFENSGHFVYIEEQPAFAETALNFLR